MQEGDVERQQIQFETCMDELRRSGFLLPAAINSCELTITETGARQRRLASISLIFQAQTT